MGGKCQLNHTHLLVPIEAGRVDAEREGVAQTSILTPSFSLCAVSFAGVLVLGATAATSSLVAFATSLLRGGMVPLRSVRRSWMGEMLGYGGYYRRIGRISGSRLVNFFLLRSAVLW